MQEVLASLSHIIYTTKTMIAPTTTMIAPTTTIAYYPEGLTVICFYQTVSSSCV